MTQLLDKNARILTARVQVPANTPSSTPYKQTIVSQLPIIESVVVRLYSASDAVTPIETGWKMETGKNSIIPDMGSIDSLAQECYAPIQSNQPFESFDINAQIQGPPYNVDFFFYNTDAAAIAHYMIVLRVAPKVELPIAPIVSDKKDNGND